MKKLWFLMFVVTCAMGAVGCTNSDMAQLRALGHDAKITLYSATGNPIGEWHSTGKVRTEDQSDGYYFMNKADGKLIRITGTIIIEQEDK